ncbi:MAG: hypothetical protein LRY73_15390 [Bacillus sp. (in: Bacteria)]|nr:hypothetical protein [Bacillus sp. (in: firmicutes)]
MNNRKVYTISAFIFIVMLSVALPFHLETTNEIVNKQSQDESISGFFFGENGRRESRFQPREYIQRSKAYDMEESVIEGN